MLNTICSQHGGVLVMRNGDPAALVFGVEGMVHRFDCQFGRLLSHIAEVFPDSAGGQRLPR